ncbi:MAG: hypothetical protein NTX66_02470 [Candidatus Falkowbacteria bacterium]|nr:hypothetical protein [Candidatus Falkowbacteria bacterium]
MTSYEEARLDSQKKDFWFWSKVLALVVVAINVGIYLFLYLRYGHWHSFTYQDIAEIKIIEFDYDFPWWTNIIFSFLWLFLTLWVYWRLHLRWFKLDRAKVNLGKFQGRQRLDEEEELKLDFFIVDLYKFSLNFGGVGLGLLAAIYFGGALYGLVANIIFDLYFHGLMIMVIMIWSFIEPLYKFIFKRKSS